MTGKLIAEHTKPDDIVLIYGMQWNPAVAYYSGRRAVMAPADLAQPNTVHHIRTWYGETGKQLQWLTAKDDMGRETVFASGRVTRRCYRALSLQMRRPGYEAMFADLGMPRAPGISLPN
jgi:hypothetical protein